MGPCLCGDPFCPRCFPGGAQLEECPECGEALNVTTGQCDHCGWYDDSGEDYYDETKADEERAFRAQLENDGHYDY